MNGHEFQPTHSADWVASYWVAGCSCGWRGAYTHAAERYAREDFDFHVKTVQSTPAPLDEKALAT